MKANGLFLSIIGQKKVEQDYAPELDADLSLPQDATDVPMPTVWAMPTETAIVPRTIFYLALRVDVQKWAFFVVARIEARIEVALGHFRHVVLVQKFALVALFA